MRFFTSANLRKYTLGSAVLALKVATGAAQAQDSQTHQASDNGNQIALAVILAVAGVALCVYCCCKEPSYENESPGARDDRVLAAQRAERRTTISTSMAAPQQRDIGDSYITMPQDNDATPVTVKPGR